MSREPHPRLRPLYPGTHVTTSERLGAKRWFLLILIGVIGGVLSGMFGIGGGIIMVPLLITFAGMDQRSAAATSLLAIVPTAIAGSATYLINGQIDLLAGLIIAVGAVGGAIIGTALLRRIPLVWLRWIFIALILVVAARMLLVAPERGDALEMSGLLALGYLALGLVMGIASGLFGIGGGIIAVPSLIAVFGMSDLIAKGTSLLVMIPTGITGTITNARAGLVQLRVGLIVGVAATLAAIPGVALALLLTPRVSGILFAALLLVAATQLTIKAIRAQRKQ
jgi:uncharacterized membrane protein YfcA